MSAASVTLLVTLLVPQPATADLGNHSPPLVGARSYYLAFRPQPAKPSPGRLLAVEPTMPEMLGHLHEDNTNLSEVLIYDARGRELTIDNRGHVKFSGSTVNNTRAIASILETFRLVRRQAAHDLVGKPKSCTSAKKATLKLLTPTTVNAEGQPLSLQAVALDASKRVSRAHKLDRTIPMRCFRQSITGHKGGYLHNLWHRITGTS